MTHTVMITTPIRTTDQFLIASSHCARHKPQVTNENIDINTVAFFKTFEFGVSLSITERNTELLLSPPPSPSPPISV